MRIFFQTSNNANIDNVFSVAALIDIHYLLCSSALTYWQREPASFISADLGT